MVCAIETDLDYKFMDLFPMFWCSGHFLMGNEYYVYKEDDEEEI